jgi:hypothetical protein
LQHGQAVTTNACRCATKAGRTGYREMPAADHAGTHGHRQIFVHGLLQLFAGYFSFFIMEHVFWSP